MWTSGGTVTLLTMESPNLVWGDASGHLAAMSSAEAEPTPALTQACPQDHRLPAQDRGWKCGCVGGAGSLCSPSSSGLGVRTRLTPSS